MCLRRKSWERKSGGSVIGRFRKNSWPSGRAGACRSFEPVEGYVQIAEYGQDEGMVDADPVGQDALQFWNDSAAYDGCDQQGGAVSGERAQAVDSQGEDAGNMMELNRPTSRMDHIARCPELSIEITTSRPATSALNPSKVPGRIFCSRAEP